mgnify:FL=1
MVKQVIQLTEDGLSELVAELEALKSRRTEIANRIAEARDFGDLRENSEYDAARGEQTAVETRIVEIEDIIQKAEVIEAGSGNKVHVGSIVTIQRLADKKEFTYRVVGSIEANPAEGRVSDESPMGAGLLNQKVGDVVSIHAPKGPVEYKILSLE